MNEWMSEGMNGAPKALPRSFLYSLRGRKEASYFWDQPARLHVGRKETGQQEVLQKLLDLQRVGEPQPASVAAERGKVQGTGRDVSESAAP